MEVWSPLQKCQLGWVPVVGLAYDVSDTGKGAGDRRALKFADEFGLFGSLSNSRPVDDRTNKFPFRLLI